MIKNFLVLVLFAVATNASAIELRAYKSTTSSVVTIDDASLEKLWASSQPACLKDGSKIMGVNKAFTDKRLGYRDCSKGIGATKKHNALGYSVAVVSVSELSDAMIKKVFKN